MDRNAARVWTIIDASVDPHRKLQMSARNARPPARCGIHDRDFWPPDSRSRARPITWGRTMRKTGYEGSQANKKGALGATQHHRASRLAPLKLAIVMPAT